MNTPHLRALAAVSLGCSLSAQTVDMPSAALATPPDFAFPFYTPAAGAAGDTVRVQLLCPATVLTQQAPTAGLVARVGFSLAGQAVYDVLELRAGTAGVATLGTDWNVNLPDQRVQRDLGNVLLVGGGSPTAPNNQWVEFELDHPFHYVPGDGVVVDVTARVAVAGPICGTTVGGGQVQRAYNFQYAPGAPATNVNLGGISFRLVFAPEGLVPFGAGCASSTQVAELGSIGAPALGGTLVLTVDGAAPLGFGGLLAGSSRRDANGTALPLDLGGGCALLVAPHVFTPLALAPTGSGTASGAYALALPADPLLWGATIYVQFVQFDPTSPAGLPFALSNGGIVAAF